MGPEGAVNILYRRELQAAAPRRRAAARRWCASMRKFSNPYVAAERGFVDAVIPRADAQLHRPRPAQLRGKRVATPARSTATSRCRARGRDGPAIAPCGAPALP